MSAGQRVIPAIESYRPSMQDIHQALIGLASHFDDAAVQHIVQSKAQLLRWSPLAVARCLKAVPSPCLRKPCSPDINAAAERGGMATTGFSAFHFPEPRCDRQGPPHMRFVLPELLPTSQRRMCESILECVQTWNFPLHESASCCPLHAALQVVNAVACKLALGIPCQQDFKPSFTGQCKICGLLLDENVDTCEKCVREQV